MSDEKHIFSKTSIFIILKKFSEHVTSYVV